jgi:hypothetical protein
VKGFDERLVNISNRMTKEKKKKRHGHIADVLTRECHYEEIQRHHRIERVDWESTRCDWFVHVEHEYIDSSNLFERNDMCSSEPFLTGHYQTVTFSREERERERKGVGKRTTAPALLLNNRLVKIKSRSNYIVYTCLTWHENKIIEHVHINKFEISLKFPCKTFLYWLLWSFFIDLVILARSWRSVLNKTFAMLNHGVTIKVIR